MPKLSLKNAGASCEPEECMTGRLTRARKETSNDRPMCSHTFAIDSLLNGECENIGLIVELNSLRIHHTPDVIYRLATLMSGISLRFHIQITPSAVTDYNSIVL